MNTLQDFMDFINPDSVCSIFEKWKDEVSYTGKVSRIPSRFFTREVAEIQAAEIAITLRGRTTKEVGFIFHVYQR